MGRDYRIRVYGRQRKQIDPCQLAQVLILLGRHMYDQNQRAAHGGADKPKTAPKASEPRPESDAGPCDGG